MTMKNSFSTRLSMYIILATAGLFISSFSILGLILRKALKDEMTDLATSGLVNTKRSIESYMTEVESAVENMVWIVEKHIDEPEYMYFLTHKLVEYNPLIVGSAVAFIPDFYPEKGKYYSPYTFKEEGTGKIKSMQLGNDNYNYFEMDWFKTTREAGYSRWSEPYFDEGGGEQQMTTYTVPVFDKVGNVVAIITADISVKSLTGELAAIHQFPNSYSFIISDAGEFVSLPSIMTHLEKAQNSGYNLKDNPVLLQIGSKMDVEASGNIEYKSVINGKRSLLIWNHLDNGWAIATMCPYKDVYGGMRIANVILFSMLFFSLFLLFFITKRVIKLMTQPITQFAYTAMSIGKGNFQTKIPEVSTKDEFMHMHNSMSYMLESVNTYISELHTTTASNERFESELNIARAIQLNMLKTNFIDNDKVDIFARVEPAKEVGGDLYDFRMNDNTLYFTVGDVSGKGVPAALFMAISRAAFGFVSGMHLDCNDVIGKINNAFCDGNSTSMFITMFAGKLNMETMELSFCNAGHNPIVIISPDGKAEYLKAKPNIAAGLFEGFPYENESIKVEHGTRLLLYTDGVTEAETVIKEQYGEDRLLEYAGRIQQGTNSQDAVTDLIQSVHTFAGGNEQNDDITVMSILIK